MSTPYTSTEADLLALLTAGETVLLPNPRAARQLRSAFHQHHRENNAPAWQPPSALAWPQWTARLYATLILSGAESRILLNAAQQHLLWRNIIAADPPPGSLSSLDSLAELAAAAFDLAASYNILNRLRPSATTADTLAFARWSDAFLQTCRREACLPAALLDHALADHITAQRCDPPAHLHLAGFAQLTPAQQVLLSTLEAGGAQVHHHTLQSAATPQPATLTRAASPREELLFAAQWTRRYLEANGTTARVAILTPTLAEDRDELEAVLRDTLTPELQSIHADLSSTPWQFSTGTPLATQPILATALSIATFAFAPLTIGELSALLLSPYLCNHADRDTIAQFDAQVLRQAQLLRPELTLSAFLDLASASSRTIATTFRGTALFANLRNLHLHLQREGDLTRRRTYAAWTDLLRELFNTAAWAATPLNPSDFAATQAWEGALDTLATLDITGQTIAFTTALDALHRQLTSTSQTPPSTNPPMQIMSIAESLGSTFDAVLFLRATDAHWPPPERPHPLLPFALQRSAAMPGTDPAAAVARARELTASLITRSSLVLFTAAKEDADGHVRPSSLLADLPLASEPSPCTAPPTLTLDITPDATPVPTLPPAAAHGGASLLKLQAACGFQAFAALRLNATQPGTLDLGLDAAESGDLVHTVLQHLWTTITSQRELAALTPDERSQLLHHCIDATLAQASHTQTAPWDDAYLALVRERLFKLLAAWLPFELERSPFTVIATEQQEFVTLGPLTLSVRVDRIDRIDDGPGPAGTVFIDYKTGATARPSQWTTPRPEEPQLPLYTLLLDDPANLRALAFARLRAGKDMQWAGWQSEPFLLGPKAKKAQDLAAEIDQWRTILTQLAEDFHDGRAVVDPRDFPGTCRYCDQRLLCRVDPALLQRLDPDAEEAEEAADA